MGTGIMAWIIGPQLIGLIFILAGFIQKTYPPKQINRYYGYRMPSATKNQQTWDEANRYSAIYMIKMGCILLMGGLLVTLLITRIVMPDKVKFALSYLVLLVSAMGSAIAVMLSTEKHLGKTFDPKQP